ncbi:MAG: PAS domain S-box protein, partial [Sneathiella sp.]|nr:PAS domain S-box protein [Sneathiella sp.]
TPDGLKHHLIVKFALRDKSENLLGVGLIASDITELTEAENELKRASEELEKEVARRTQELSEEIAIRQQTEEELRNILSDSPIAVGISKPRSGYMSFANESLCKLLGRPREELVGHSTIQFWPDIAVRDRLIKEFRENGRTEPIETQIYAKDKKKLWVLPSWTSLTIDGESVIVSWLQDIEKIKTAEVVLQQSNEELEARVAERTQALKAEIDVRLKVEEALREREQLLETYATASSDWFWGMDTEFRYNSLSDKFEQLTGIPVSSLIGKYRWEYVVPSEAGEQVDAFWKEHRKLLERHEPFRDMPVHIQTSDGSTLHALTSGVPIFDKNGKFDGYVGIGRDVTEAVKAQQHAEAMEIQLRQSQKMEAIGQLTGGIAHDFNNILAIILGNTELMQEMVPPDDQLQRFLGSIDRSANRGAQLTQRLLAYSRKQELRPEKLNINKLIANIGELVDRLISEEIEVTYNFNTATRDVLADPGQLENAFVNICINARDAMPEGGQLDIKTNNLVIDARNQDKYPDLKPGQYSYLCITDTGNGMDEETLAHAFEPFFTTKETGKGTGLGLSMIYGFARQSGGTVSLASTPGHGTRARLILPSVMDEN